MNLHLSISRKASLFLFPLRYAFIIQNVLHYESTTVTVAQHFSCSLFDHSDSPLRHEHTLTSFQQPSADTLATGSPLSMLHDRCSSWRTSTLFSVSPGPKCTNFEERREGATVNSLAPCSLRPRHTALVFPFRYIPRLHGRNWLLITAIFIIAFCLLFYFIHIRYSAAASMHHPSFAITTFTIHFIAVKCRT